MGDVVNLAPDETDTALVIFMPSGRRGRFAHGTPLLDAARALGVYVESVCGGRGICGRCQISVAEGEFAKLGIRSSADHVGAPTDTERRYGEKRSLHADRRLSCQARVTGNLVIDVPQDAQVNRQIIRKRAEARRIARDPATRLAYVEVPQPDMATPSGDLDRLIHALNQEFGYEGLDCDPHLIPQIQALLRLSGWAVTAAIHQDRGRPTIVGLFPGYRERLFGLAVDIGSTTIAAHLCDLMSGRTVASSGTSNPQIRFGEDLMSRVSYVMMNPGGREALTTAVRGAIETLITKVSGDAGVETSEILEAVFVGNPIMHHLFLGIDPTPLGGAPFALAVSRAVACPARDLGLGIAEGARVYMLPCIAGHVGADAAAVALSEAPHRSDKISLVVDVGTNAEILLGNRHRLLAASSPTGPAFEGAEIRCGQRAASGAIERVRIDRQTFEPHIKVIGIDAWSHEPEFAEAVETVGVTGICGSGIIEVVGEMFLCGLLTPDGVIDGSKAQQSDRIIAHERTHAYRLWPGDIDLIITQNDIRAIQLAKAALYAGIRLLMDRLSVTAVDRIKLAGAFGNYIDPLYAMVLGLIPDCPPDQIANVGNAAGTGARMALLNRGHREEIEALVRRTEKIETATEPNFQTHFVNAMALPHKTDSFDQLAKAVDLPQATESAPQSKRRRRAKPR